MSSELLPFSPTNVSLSFVENGRSILVRWSKPSYMQDKVDHYTIYYNYSGNPAQKQINVVSVFPIAYIVWWQLAQNSCFCFTVNLYEFLIHFLALVMIFTHLHLKLLFIQYWSIIHIKVIYSKENHNHLMESYCTICTSGCIFMVLKFTTNMCWKASIFNVKKKNM